MFDTKPSSPTEELEQLRTVFDGRDLAAAVGRTTETITRWNTRDGFSARIERFLDDLWSITALVARKQPDPVRIRFLLTSRREELDWRPATQALFEEGFGYVLGAFAPVVGEQGAADVPSPKPALPLTRLNVPRDFLAPGTRSLPQQATGLTLSQVAARTKFIERTRTHEGIDIDAFDDVHEHSGW